MKDNETFIPLSSSPLPVKVNWLPAECFPVLAAPPWVCSRPKAEPATDVSPAFAETATREPANADNPIFLIFHN